MSGKQTEKRVGTPGRVLHTVKTRDGGRKALRIGRKQAIQLCCVECLGWDIHPKDCTSPLCPLFPFRGMTMASQRSGTAGTGTETGEDRQ